MTGLPPYPMHQDYLADTSGSIFQVLTSCHPAGRAIALLRYVLAEDPADPNALWAPRWGRGQNLRYRRQLRNYNVFKAGANVDFVEAHHPEYLLADSIYGVPLIAVPDALTATYFSPRQRLQELLAADGGALDAYEQGTVAIARALNGRLGIPTTDIGVTGSILWQAQHRYSDIDMIIYGLQNMRAYVAGCAALFADGGGLAAGRLTGLDDSWREEFARSLAEKSGLPLDECRGYLRRKSWLPLYHDHSIREQPVQVGLYFAPLEAEVAQFYPPYGAERYRTLGNVKVQATIAGDAAGLFYPAIYEIDGVTVVENAGAAAAPVDPAAIQRIFLFEGAIAGYVHTGDRVEAAGLLQEVNGPDGTACYQVFIGTRENYGREYIRLI